MLSYFSLASIKILREAVIETKKGTKKGEGEKREEVNVYTYTHIICF